MDAKTAAAQTGPDYLLVESARLGDKDAFGVLLERHRARCLDRATAILSDSGEAEDDVQTAFAKAYLHLDQYAGDAEFGTWLSRIVTNECLMSMRLRRRARFVYLDESSTEMDAAPKEVPDCGSDPEGELAFDELIRILRTEIRRLPPLLRNVLLLRDIQELSLTEVAKQLGLTVPAAKSRLLRARIELRLRLMRHVGKVANISPLSRSAAPVNRVAPHCPIRLAA